MRKFGTKGGCMSFTWPEDVDQPIMSIKTLEETCKPLPDPIPLRRGNIEYPTYVFNKIPLSMIY